MIRFVWFPAPYVDSTSPKPLTLDIIDFPLPFIAVDGVALGAAMKEGNSAVGFIVFIAIMLHKAPSAFGLTSYLLHHGLSRESVLKRLVFFCFAAPVGTILTYLFLSLNLFVYHEVRAGGW